MKEYLEEIIKKIHLKMFENELQMVKPVLTSGQEKLFVTWLTQKVSFYNHEIFNLQRSLYVIFCIPGVRRA